MPKKIAVIVGSLRRESLNRKLAEALVKLAPPTLACEFVELGELPMYNEDLETSVPKAWSDFRVKLAAMDGVLFVSPEYNRTIPGVVKNAIDVGSRPTKNSVWDKKPAAVVTSSQGAPGGMAANFNIRQALTAVGMVHLSKPEAYLGKVQDLLQADGTLVAASNEYMKMFMEAFGAFVQRNS